MIHSVPARIAFANRSTIRAASSHPTLLPCGTHVATMHPMTAAANRASPPPLQPYAPGVRDLAALLARARISDIDQALSDWPRCAQCHRCLPLQRVLRTDDYRTLARCCCRKCNAKLAAKRWRRIKASKERQARAIAEALDGEPSPQGLIVRATPPARVPVRIYHAGRTPLWTIELVEAKPKPKRRR